MKNGNRRSRLFLVLMAFLLFVLTGSFLFSSCQKRYKVDYCGRKASFKNARNSYPAGAKVRLVYYMIATDTDYYFYLDDESLNYRFESEGIIIEFTMPDHDVTLSIDHKNSMDVVYHKVDYCNQQSWYENAEDQYTAGDKVTLLMDWGTDTSYQFYLDGERIEAFFTDDERYLVIEFIMPDKDVKLFCEVESLSPPGP